MLRVIQLYGPDVLPLVFNEAQVTLGGACAGGRTEFHFELQLLSLLIIIILTNIRHIKYLNFHSPFMNLTI